MKNVIENIFYAEDIAFLTESQEMQRMAVCGDSNIIYEKKCLEVSIISL